MSKKKRKSIFDDLFDFSIFDEFEEMFNEESLGESGYYINVTQINGKTKVYVKAGENVDIAALKQDLKRRYPGAEIIIEGEKPLLEEIKIEPIEKKEEDKIKIQKKEKKTSLIEEIKNEEK
jgi:outer membrane translocation and assembly module TamA